MIVHALVLYACLVGVGVFPCVVACFFGLAITKLVLHFLFVCFTFALCTVFWYALCTIICVFVCIFFGQSGT